jgi:hypothetical protein
LLQVRPAGGLTLTCSVAWLTTPSLVTTSVIVYDVGEVTL